MTREEEEDSIKEGEVKECSIIKALGQNQPSKRIKMTGFKEGLTRTHMAEQDSTPVVEDRVNLTKMIEI